MPSKHPLMGHVTKVFSGDKYQLIGYTNTKKNAVTARKRMSVHTKVRITKDRADGIYKIWEIIKRGK